MRMFSLTSEKFPACQQLQSDIVERTCMDMIYGDRMFYPPFAPRVKYKSAVYQRKLSNVSTSKQSTGVVTTTTTFPMSCIYQNTDVFVVTKSLKPLCTWNWELCCNYFCPADNIHTNRGRAFFTKTRNFAAWYVSCVYQWSIYVFNFFSPSMSLWFGAHEWKFGNRRSLCLTLRSQKNKNKLVINACSSMDSGATTREKLYTSPGIVPMSSDEHHGLLKEIKYENTRVHTPRKMLQEGLVWSKTECVRSTQSPHLTSFAETGIRFRMGLITMGPSVVANPRAATQEKFASRWLFGTCMTRKQFDAWSPTRSSDPEWAMDTQIDHNISDKKSGFWSFVRKKALAKENIWARNEPKSKPCRSRAAENPLFRPVLSCA